MQIKYLKDGIADISNDTEVACEGPTGYYIRSQTNKLQFVPREFIVSKFYKNAWDNVPNIFEYIRDSNLTDESQVDFSLAELFKTIH